MDKRKAGEEELVVGSMKDRRDSESESVGDGIHTHPDFEDDDQGAFSLRCRSAALEVTLSLCKTDSVLFIKTGVLMMERRRERLVTVGGLRTARPREPSGKERRRYVCLECLLILLTMTRICLSSTSKS